MSPFQDVSNPHTFLCRGESCGAEVWMNALLFILTLNDYVYVCVVCVVVGSFVVTAGSFQKKI